MSSGLKEPHTSMTDAHAAAMVESQEKQQRNAKHKRHGPAPLRLHQGAGKHAPGAQGLAEAKHDKNVQERKEGEGGAAAGEADSEGSGIAFPRLPSTMSDVVDDDVAGLSDHDHLGSGAAWEAASTEEMPAGSGISAADIHSAGYSIVSALTDNLEEELDLLCGLYDKVRFEPVIAPPLTFDRVNARFLQILIAQWQWNPLQFCVWCLRTLLRFLAHRFCCTPVRSPSTC